MAGAMAGGRKVGGMAQGWNPCPTPVRVCHDPRPLGRMGHEQRAHEGGR